MSSSNISHMDPNIYHTHLTSEGAEESLDKNSDQPENEVIALSCGENLEIFTIYNQIVKTKFNSKVMITKITTRVTLLMR